MYPRLNITPNVFKKLSFLLLCLVFFSCTKKHSWFEATSWLELEPEEMSQLETVVQDLMVYISTNRAEELWTRSHPLLKEVGEKQKEALFLTLEQLASTLPQNATFEIQNGCVIHFYGKTLEDEVVCGKEEPGSSQYIKIRIIEGIEKMAVVFLSIPQEKLMKTATMILGYYNESYRLLHLSINTTAINNKNAYYFYNRGDELEGQNKLFPASLCYGMALHLAQLGPNCRSGLKTLIDERFTRLQQNEDLKSEIQSFYIEGNDYPIERIAFFEANGYVSPTIWYQTKVPSGEQTSKSEASLLLNYLETQYDSISEEFDIFIFIGIDKDPQSGKTTLKKPIPLTTKNFRARETINKPLLDNTESP